jgi:hypothetical protein
MKKSYLLVLLLAYVIFSGCSITHPIAKDYNQYLINNENQSALPKTSLESEYSIEGKTVSHRYEFRAATVGYAHLWVVEFGKMLEENLKANYVQNAFGKLEKQNPMKSTPMGNLILFTLENYEFKDFKAHVSLNIRLTVGKDDVINKTYHSTGKSQGEKMFWGGPFAMKNATQQSTKLAIDQILTEFIEDFNSKNAAK